jgi:hypothetical protein
MWLLLIAWVCNALCNDLSMHDMKGFSVFVCSVDVHCIGMNTVDVPSVGCREHAIFTAVKN